MPSTVGVYKQITLLVLCCFSSRLVILLEFVHASIHVSNILVLTDCFRLINFAIYFLTLICLLVACFSWFMLLLFIQS
jgi:hypothetical protein